MATIAERLVEVHGAIAAACDACGRDPQSVQLLPVSKRHPAEAILEAQAAGVTTFGENRVQELREKDADDRLASVAWHFIGSVQTNKVGQLARIANLTCIQSLDRRKLADALQPAFYAEGRTLDVLLQIDATGDTSKHGVLPGEAEELVCHVMAECPNLSVTGLMAMGPREGDPAPVFDEVARLRESLRDATGLAFPMLSMGMTGDMAAAIAAGSTMVRVGTGVFGTRPAPG